MQCEDINGFKPEGWSQWEDICLELQKRWMVQVEIYKLDNGNGIGLLYPQGKVNTNVIVVEVSEF